MVQLSRLALILAVLFLSISASVAARSAPSQPATPVAYTDGKALNLVDPGTNRVVKSVLLKHEPRALAVDPKENMVWVVTQQRLLKFNTAGEQVLDLKELRRSAGGTRDEDDEGEEEGEDGEDGGHTRTLALNPYDGSLWISRGKMLLHLDKNGNLTGSNKLRDPVRAFGVALDESVWVLGKKELLHFSRDGGPLPGIKLDNRAKDPESLALDDIGGYIWVSGEKGVLRIKQAESPESPLYIPIKKEVKGLVVNPFDGTLGVYGKEQLSLYGRDGKLLKSVDLRPYRLDDHTSVSYDAANRSVWVGGKKTVLRFDERGSLLAKFSLKKEGRAVGVAPLHLVPGLSLISPPEGTLTNDPKPPVRLGLQATCNGAPCPPELDYLKRLRIEATLNDRAIGNLFAIDKGEATYTPQERLPEGKNTLAAEAVDPFGHRSTRITSNFTVIPSRRVLRA